jgi:hypothetical protein
VRCPTAPAASTARAVFDAARKDPRRGRRLHERRRRGSGIRQRRHDCGHGAQAEVEQLLGPVSDDLVLDLAQRADALVLHLLSAGTGTRGGPRGRQPRRQRALVPMQLDADADTVGAGNTSSGRAPPLAVAGIWVGVGAGCDGIGRRQRWMRPRDGNPCASGNCGME